MSPAAAKLLMCTCAGAVGAVSVPAYHRARATLRPRPALHRPITAQAAAVPCLPFGSGQAVSMGAGSVPAADSGEVPPVAPEISASLALGAPAPGGAWASGIAGAGRGPGLAPSFPPALTSSAPEPASWAMLIVGLGAVGGGIRWQRAAPAR